MKRGGPGRGGPGYPHDDTRGRGRARVIRRGSVEERDFDLGNGRKKIYLSEEFGRGRGRDLFSGARLRVPRQPGSH